MKITVTESMFKDQFKAYGRADNFSSAGLSALYAYLEELENITCEELELDVIAICCDYSEASYEEIADDFNLDLSSCDDIDEEFDAVLDWLNDETVVIHCDGKTGMILYQNF